MKPAPLARGVRCPELFKAISYNALPFFLLANVLTGSLKGHTTDFFISPLESFWVAESEIEIFFWFWPLLDPPLTLRKSVLSDQKRVINDHDR